MWPSRAFALAVAVGAAVVALRRPGASTVEEEYADAASSFDVRWSEYISVTVDAMLAQLGPALDALPCAAASCKLLDVGCGTGALAHRIARRHPRWEVTCSDLSAEMLRGAAAKGLAPSKLRFGGSGNDALVYGLSPGSPECADVPPQPAGGKPGCGYITPGCLNATH